jgi:hypothetical protein
MQAVFLWESSKYYVLWLCVCSLNYPACKAHVSYNFIRVTCQTVPYFSTLFRGCYCFRKNVVEHKIVFWYSLKLFSFYEEILIQNKARYSYEFCIKIEFSQQIFWKTPEISSFMVIHSMVAELFHADGRKDRQTDMTKLIVALRSFTKAPKSENWQCHHYGRNVWCYFSTILKTLQLR